MNTQSKTFAVGSAIALISTLALAGCASTAADNNSYKLQKNDVHFPIRTISDLDVSKITTFRADMVIEDNCTYATNVRGKAPSKKYVLTWPKGSTMEYSGKTLNVVSKSADMADKTRSVAAIDSRVEFTGVLKDEPFKYRKGYHAPTELRNCKANGIARVASWKTVRRAQ